MAHQYFADYAGRASNGEESIRWRSFLWALNIFSFTEILPGGCAACHNCSGVPQKTTCHPGARLPAPARAPDQLRRSSPIVLHEYHWARQDPATLAASAECLPGAVPPWVHPGRAACLLTDLAASTQAYRCASPRLRVGTGRFKLI